MAVKEIDLPDIGRIKLYKRKGARSIRLSIDTQGDIRVTLPFWMPYETGTRFAVSKRTWILEQQQYQQPVTLKHGQAVGKSHHLYFWGSLEIDKPIARIKGTNINVSHPLHLAITHSTVQKAAEKACIKALRAQASALLPQRLETLAATHAYQYKSINIKQLTGRWGSCDAETNIVFNLFLMQLPWHLIDYVIMHELAHTRVLHHGPLFWKEFEAHLPNARKLRQEMKQYRPMIGYIPTE